ncbi:enoyl-CoA hydratase [Paracoccus spongiarum]|uniref:Enoyl-CoA hydratase domain-containing protein 3, mitochondrial n=1 Tax=Paracoccus spongiarum TaxID=3064387 RepID=A0ABT9JBN9_9RHOB|nr:enoyl-CoA hydratase [Paracoccus sp. 2205BS29-5]MDP5307254.1 enoyl-CoA hydratase [Paracoccus sp. 2205BS29-5]
MQDLVLRDDTGHVARLRLNNGARFNPLSLEMIDALADAFRLIASDDRIRAVILAAEGKAFSVGHDLRQMQRARADDDAGRRAYEALFARCAGMMQMIPDLPQPVIAEVQGVATAAGCQLVASCDLAIAADTARFGVNGVDIGLFCATPMVALTRAVPPRAAFEMLVTGDFIDATRARDLGLVNRVAAPADLPAQAMHLAQQIAAKLPAAVRMGKRAFHDQLRLGLSEAYHHAGGTICENLMLPDTDEGIAAFLEKRRPRWAGD